MAAAMKPPIAMGGSPFAAGEPPGLVPGGGGQGATLIAIRLASGRALDKNGGKEIACAGRIYQ
jgi:hypothetical protein